MEEDTKRNGSERNIGDSVQIILEDSNGDDSHSKVTLEVKIGVHVDEKPVQKADDMEKKWKEGDLSNTTTTEGS